MSNLGTFLLAGGTFTITGSGSGDVSNMPAAGDYLTIGTEKFVFHTNAASASALGYVYTGTTHAQCVANLNMAINTANQRYYRRPAGELTWKKTDPKYADDLHYDGRYIFDGVLNGIAQSSASISGSTVAISAIASAIGF